MKRTLIITLACTLGVMLSGVTAQAVPINLTVGDAYYLGVINDGVPAGEAQEAGYINYLKTLAAGQGNIQLPAATGEIYNRLSSTVGGPFPTAVFADKLPVGENGIYNLSVSGYAYVLAKYGNNPSLVWFVNGAVGEIKVPANYSPLASGGGLSHISWFTPVSVPDGGMTLMLLGGALVGIGALRRKFSA